MQNCNNLRLMKTLSVIVFLFALFIHPPAIAGQTTEQAEAAAAMANVLHALKGTLKARKSAAESGAGHGLRAAWQPLDLKPVRQEIQNLDVEVRADFAQIEAGLHGLPEEIRRRHFDTTAQYGRDMNILLQNLETV
ncbi:MAG: hypothetical protein GY862_35745, partial [Gammaproteobacteria bacterium]|nr:hypothetical protein [Gammaproteobacteria bacterium]